MLGLIDQKDLGNGLSLYVYPLTFGRARLHIGDETNLNDSW